MKKNLFFIVTLLTVAAISLTISNSKINNLNTNKETTSVSKNATKETNAQKSHTPNMVAIFEGDKLVERFPFVYYTINGDKISFDKLKIVYENGMACFSIGSTTGELNLSDCVLYYSKSELALAEGSHETLPEQGLADGAKSKTLLRSLLG